MKNTLKDAIEKKKDPYGFELKLLRAELSQMKDMQSNGLKEIAEMVFERKVEEMKSDIFEQLEGYVGDVTETLVNKNLRGEKGEPGKDGKDGAPGPMGPRGYDGAEGPIGKTGLQGQQGEKGEEGKEGKVGPTGPAGKDSSVTVEEVIEKITPELNRILEEARNTLKSMRPARQISGGGMSTPTTFSFTGNGADTSFALSTKVAAEGRAIWAYANGQWLQPNTHFTVSGKTFTTTFTPASGDIIEGFYLRA